MKSLSQQLASIERLLELQVIQSKELLSTEEAAAYLDLSLPMIHKLTSERKIVHFKPSGKKIYFKPKDLDAWAFQNKVRTKEELNENINFQASSFSNEIDRGKKYRK